MTCCYLLCGERSGDNTAIRSYGCCLRLASCCGECQFKSRDKFIKCVDNFWCI